MNWIVFNHRNPVLITYLMIVLVAAAIDFLTDRSGGAFSLATLPIALLAMGCFLVGQVSAKDDVKRHSLNWLLGAALVFAGLVVFAAKGGDAPKVGELIFTYAMLLIAPPASLALPWISLIGAGHEMPDVLLRSMVVWLFCVGAGAVQWVGIRWMVQKLRNRPRS